ncbi:DUF5677 domain-containing protein [Micromonospora tulbaghiae]|uniref:DUF5677 domain-containing protein n=1 Tax=Micromonospora tulbaghiae TaxID=479978 RepID=UPI003443D37E
MTLIQPPDPSLLDVAQVLQTGASAFTRNRSSATPTGEWEAPIEAWDLASLAVRSVEGLCLMARTDMGLATPALQCARATLEHTVRGIWLLHPPDRFVGEVRWLALVHEWERFEESLAKEARDVASREEYLRRASTLKDFRTGVSGRLPDGYSPLRRLPSLRDMMAEIGIDHFYPYYRRLSQPVHGTMQATGIYKRNLGTKKLHGDFGGLFDWILPMRLSWVCIRKLHEMVLRRCGPEPVEVPLLIPGELDVDEMFATMARRAYELRLDGRKG